MRYAVVASLVGAITLTTAKLVAQERLAIEPGVGVRVTAPPCGWSNQRASIAGLTNDTLLVSIEGSEVGCPRARVESLQLYRGRRHWGSGARVGAAVGAVAGAVTGYVGGHGTPDRETYTLLGAVGGTVAGAAIGLGPRARRSALVGLAVGTVVGASVFSGACEENESAGCAFIVGAAYVGAPAFVIGAGIGLALGEDEWEQVALDRIRLTITPQGDGVLTLSVLVTF
jgi:hypothetical protein